MIYVQHRVNALEHLRRIPLKYGVEVDLRDFGDRIVMRHDPFGDGEDFEPFLAEYKNTGPLILNVKSERIELRILELLSKYPVTDYFFLDCTFPMIRFMNQLGEKRIAVRFSEFEPIESAMTLAGIVDWVWVDCFTKLPLTQEIYNNLHRNFKICIVSPELQGHSTSKISEYANCLMKLPCDAICTKFPELWEKHSSEVPIY